MTLYRGRAVHSLAAELHTRLRACKISRAAAAAAAPLYFMQNPDAHRERLT